jgi:hypothetical protein
MDWFDWATEIQKNGPQGLQPITLVNCQDLSSLQKAIGRGGAAKRIENFCSFCACKSSTIADKIPACATCILKGQETCLHHPVTDKIFRSECELTIKGLEDKYPEFPKVFVDTEQLLLTFYEDQPDKENDSTNIDYKPRTKSNKKWL